ncbi:KH domain-containing, RNA-binding, signal transduction-associated protein 3-like isoform X1 [Daktulosphaira vitifoliae]|uniref:KH domain-containing, RNA-binding, signal transduction-associated protein 3-like isoform X1 n=1 Tax=Daktulosphaira vitifoliae TaxID=58002 RepID=UPI0021AACED3|nr:KH domain-containing, RNA-binding, signal transduction-associated protein 3-like isoform X1 [Daktulosphaira vitifoliae]XP_050544951.1 KH domain-containing, RNA-binding, signal transduction-associated protein 3-like isoform X1 [Daktulosphaira vitifoliae]
MENLGIQKLNSLTQSDIKNESKTENVRRIIDITRDKPIKVSIKVAVPARDHPKFNFVGKLLGPKGNSLKRLQEETITKMAILGRGSMRDRSKEEKLRNSGDSKFSHLKDDLHIEITAFAPAAEAHARIAFALTEVRRFLVPDYNDEIRQEQMWEMQVMQTNGNSCDATDSDTGESGLSLHSVDDNGLNFCTSHSISDYSPVHTKRNTDQTIIKCSETAGRKRPLIVGECTKITTNPSKRSVMAILARARATQLHRKEIVAFSPHFNGVV